MDTLTIIRPSPSLPKSSPFFTSNYTPSPSLHISYPSLPVSPPPSPPLLPTNGTSNLLFDFSKTKLNIVYCSLIACIVYILQLVLHLSKLYGMHSNKIFICRINLNLNKSFCYLLSKLKWNPHTIKQDLTGTSFYLCVCKIANL